VGMIIGLELDLSTSKKLQAIARGKNISVDEAIIYSINSTHSHEFSRLLALFNKDYLKPIRPKLVSKVRKRSEKKPIVREKIEVLLSRPRTRGSPKGSKNKKPKVPKTALDKFKRFIP